MDEKQPLAAESGAPSSEDAIAAPVSVGLSPIGEPPVEAHRGVQPNPRDLLSQKHANTARILAYGLLFMLGGTVLIHYACVMILILHWRNDGLAALQDFYHSWLPVLSGLAGSAATYYFTRQRVG